jgi:hypothetical protein
MCHEPGHLADHGGACNRCSCVTHGANPSNDNAVSDDEGTCGNSPLLRLGVKAGLDLESDDKLPGP